MSVLSQFGGGAIKSIQRGAANAGGINAAFNITISAVDTAKTELRFMGQSAADNTLTAGLNGLIGYIQLTSSTNILATRIYVGNGNWYLAWELTEFY